MEQEKNNEEKVNNDTNVEEEKVDEVSSTSITCVEVVPFSSDISFEKTIEDKRSALFDYYKKNRKISRIVTMVILVCLVAGCILAMQNLQALKIVGYSIAGAALLSMVIYFLLTRNKLPNATKEYIQGITSLFNGYIYDDSMYEKITTDPYEKVDNSKIISDGVYQNISRIGSRNVIRCKYKKEDLLVSDLAVYALKAKRTEQTLFVGRYLSYMNHLNFEDKIIICKKGSQDVDLPNFVEGYQVLEENGLSIYFKEEVDVKKVLTQSFLNSLSSFVVSSHVLNINIVLWGGYSAAYVSYDDETMVLPFDKPFVEAPLNSMKNEQKDLVSILSQL